MAPFTTHAMMRFVERYVPRMPARPRPLQQDFERFVLAARTAHFAWCGWRFPVIGSVAGSNYAQAQLVNREEAEALVAGKFRARPNRYYKSAGGDLGVWILTWAKHTPVKVVTFLARGDVLTAEEDELC